MISTVVVTGANGFLGTAICATASAMFPSVELIRVNSPRSGGLDLSDADVSAKLAARISIKEPSSALLVHAAAFVEWDTTQTVLRNAAMAANVAEWANEIGIGFSMLVSGVNVYPAVPRVDQSTEPDPVNMYGIGKWTAEKIWSLRLNDDASAIVRLAGIWGWQKNPTLFWNRLMLAAISGKKTGERPVIKRRCSKRNYISANDAAVCLLTVGEKHMSGVRLAAGMDSVGVGTFVDALSNLPDSLLEVDWQDDGGVDEVFYEPSEDLLPLLTPFPVMLSKMWNSKPVWVL